MIGASLLPVDALSTIGIVLAEALVLYVGYGALTSAVEPRVAAALEER